jgi:hypothetical protein
MTDKAIFGVIWDSQCFSGFAASLKIRSVSWNTRRLSKFAVSLGIHYDIPYNSLFVC